MKGVLTIESLLSIFSEAPIIAAVRTREQLLRACETWVRVVFILSGDLFSLPDDVQIVRNAGKLPFVHLDLLDGINRDTAGIHWIAQIAQPAGVLSTRAPLLKIAAEEGLHTVLRMFLVDSSSVETGIRMAKSSTNLVEIMPGLMTRAILQLCSRIEKPIIAGGMVERAIDVERALDSGAVAVSTSKESLWMWERHGSPEA